jgi:UDPglucose--hexose-1-phosphate uridylyltransferase
VVADDDWVTDVAEVVVAAVVAAVRGPAADGDDVALRPPHPASAAATAQTTAIDASFIVRDRSADAATVAPVSTPEIRIDPLTGLRAIIAGARAGRPGGGLSAAPAPVLDPGEDPFAAGNEDRTPPEVYAVRRVASGPNTPGWTVRVVPNLYPALSAAIPPDQLADTTAEGEPAPKPGSNANRDLFWSTPAVGAHEVIVNSPRSVTSLGELSVEEVSAAMDVWRDRILAHTGAAYVHVIVNERREAGASLPHTHAQLYALDFVPAAVARERERFGAYATRTMGGNLLGDLVQEEVRKRERIVAIDDDSVLMAPFGARVPYQLMLAPRRTRARFEDDGPNGAAMLRDALGRLARRLGASPPLNLWVRTAPRGAEEFCWRIDILPRLTHLAGLELGAGINLNIVPPEQAAAELREA